jgi:hypothetical protein
MWIIETSSGYRLGYNCLLGSGKTENEAWEDAYGMTASVAKRKHKEAWAKQVTEEEFEKLTYG